MIIITPVEILKLHEGLYAAHDDIERKQAARTVVHNLMRCLLPSKQKKNGRTKNRIRITSGSRG